MLCGSSYHVILEPQTSIKSYPLPTFPFPIDYNHHFVFRPILSNACGLQILLAQSSTHLTFTCPMESFQESTPGYQAYPEGGMKAYGVVLGAWLTLFPASGLLNSTGILQAWLFEHQLKGYTESEVSWIFSTFAFLFFLGGFIIGMLVSKVYVEANNLIDPKGPCLISMVPR
ncbi:hypothetical protein IQ07DRAFT_592166 [Pyrenochaeta sp. DS3sAY3a]|nr:hypothetical protein IQ07DRAFT_592166 [Pyrenochaeta sp. DS3sAY3a]